MLQEYTNVLWYFTKFHGYTKLYFFASIIFSMCISEHPTIRKRSLSSAIYLCFYLYISMGS